MPRSAAPQRRSLRPVSVEIVALDAEQERAAVHPLDAGLVVISGAAGTGKTLALAERARRARGTLRAGEHIIATSAAPAARAPLDASLATVAFAIAAEASPGLTLVDDARAEQVLEDVSAGLFALEWDEFLSAELDFEITGLRAPQRFAAAAYRLFRKLRMASVTPDAFRQNALRGATAFYGNPPNLGNVDLLQQTAPRYRDSLRVTPVELARQHRREVDLSAILARLYGAYLARMEALRLVTEADALVVAAATLEARAGVRAAARARYRYALVDDAQDLARNEERFLRALFGAPLQGVTLAADPDQRTTAFAGARAAGLIESAAHRFELATQHRSTAQTAAAARAILAPAGATAFSIREAMLHRAQTVRAEAAYVADGVAKLLQNGTPAREIAVIARNLRCIDPYLSALVTRGVPVDPAGQGSLYAFADVEDALAALWSIADPYRHDWLLRNLEAPWLRLADATIAALCREPPSAQATLFALPAGAEETDRRWDRRRDVRLARNVLLGENDEALSAVARERLAAFRAARRTWLEEERRLDAPALAAYVFAETVLAGGGSDARARLRRGLVERLLAALEEYAAANPRATLHDALLHAEGLARGDDDLLRVRAHDPDAVAVLGVEAAKGREFAHVFVVGVHAGAFPRYYVPDAFLYSQKHGMLPKENAGADTGAARSAKFTYFQHKLGLQALYYGEERRALYCAASRARERFTLSAWGRATRGVSAPEFVEELRGTFAADDAGG
jgi:superfamily I DNA/RNA helicase